MLTISTQEHCLHEVGRKCALEIGGRSWQEEVKRAILAGSKHPLVMVQGSMPGKVAKERELAGLLGALAAVYLPLEMRGWKKEARKVEGLGWSWGKEMMD